MRQDLLCIAKTRDGKKPVVGYFGYHLLWNGRLYPSITVVQKNEKNEVFHYQIHEVIEDTVEFLNASQNDVKREKITEEHLKSFGFKKHRDGDVYWYTKSCGKNKPQLTTNDIGEIAYSDKLEFVFIDQYDNIKLKYVDQVQNLFFALTGRQILKKQQ